jgi:PAS domain S-box-containing protein
VGNGVSRAVIEVLLDRVSQGAATLSPDDQIIYANQRLATLLGVTRAQLIGRVLAELAAEPDRAALAEAIAQGRDGASQCRVTLPRADGELHALLTFAPLGHGQVSCILTRLDAREDR